MEVTDCDYVISNAWPEKPEEVETWQRNLLLAIQERSTSDIRRLLDGAPLPLDELLNKSLVVKPDGETIISQKDMNGPTEDFQFTLPIILSVVHGDYEIALVFRTHGANIFVQDVGGHNIFHALCWAAAYKPERECHFCQLYGKFLDLFGTDKQRELLCSEDVDGLRPLELAGRLGAFKLMCTILETEGIYKTVVPVSPIGKKIRFDLTEYAAYGRSSKRRALSPLEYIRQMLVTDLDKEGTKDIFENPLFQKWISRKLRDARIFVMFGVFLNVFNIVTFTIIDDFGNDESCPRDARTKTSYISSKAKWAMFYVGAWLHAAYRTFQVIFTIIGARIGHGTLERMCRLQRPKMFGGRSGWVATNKTFGVINLIVMLLLITYTIVTFCVRDWRDGALGQVMLMTRVTLQISFWWSLLYVVQLLPGIGHLVTGAFRCLAVFFYFILIFLMFFMACAEGVRSVSVYYCLDKLGYSLNSLYATFLLMQNMLNTKDLNSKLSWPPLPVVIMHVQIVLVLVVLLINFLIALLSDEVGNIKRHEGIIRYLIKLNVASDALFVYDGIHDILPERFRINQKHFFVEYDETTI